MSHTNEIEAFRMFHRRVSAVQLNECRIGRDALISQPSRNSFGAANRPSSAPPPASRAVRRRSEIAPLKARAYGCSVAIDVRPATADRWSDLVAVFGRRGQDPSWCWCQLFLRSGAEDTSAPAVLPDNRTALHEEIGSASVPPGLIAYVDDQPAGWTRIQPRASLPGLRGNKALARVLSEDPAGIWWITCFAVDSRHRRMGVGSALLRGAVDFAHLHGATAVEGHPVDVAGLRAERVSGSSLYTGTKAMFAGFVEVARTAPTRPVMRLSLRGRLPL